PRAARRGVARTRALRSAIAGLGSRHRRLRREDNLADWAAALTYYGLLALFPALISLVAIVGLFGDPRTTTSTITDMVTAIGPQSAARTFAGPIKSITSNQSAAGFALVLGLAAALWSASGYVGAFIRASNVIYETPEGRPFWKL